MSPFLHTHTHTHTMSEPQTFRSKNSRVLRINGVGFSYTTDHRSGRANYHITSEQLEAIVMANMPPDLDKDSDKYRMAYQKRLLILFDKHQDELTDVVARCVGWG